jgi:hypothetical protein
MPKVTFVKSARKDYPNQGITKGESYYHWSFMSGGKGGPKIRSKRKPRPSQLTQSEFWSQVLSWQESADDKTPELSDIESEIGELKSDIEALRDEQLEKHDNLPPGLQDGPSGELIQGRYDALDEAYNILDSIEIPSLEDLDFETPEEKADQVWGEVRDALSNISCD